MDTATAVGTVQLPVAPVRRTAPFDSLALESAYLAELGRLDGDAEARRAADDLLVREGVRYHEGPVSWSYVPKIFSRADVAHLAWVAETMGGIMEKVTRAYAAREEVRRFFGLDPRIEELARRLPAAGETIPIARVDIFLNEKTGAFQFCELNTDGSSGMLTTAGVTRANALTGAGRRLTASHAAAAFDVMGACADAVIDAYRAVGGEAEHPVFAVVDYIESIAREEIAAFAPVFEARGARLHVADIRDLTYRDGRLADADGPIDGVWRRVVVSEMLEKPCAGAGALMAAAEEGRVPVIGGFCTWPVATKTVFALLHDPLAATMLSEEELAFVRDHVPETDLLDPESDLSRFHDRSRWIAKPRDGYNSSGVHAGSDCTEEEWQGILAEMAATGGMVQAYAPQFASMNVEGGAAGVGRSPVPYDMMEGLYLFGGRFGGVFTRCGTQAVIGEFTDRLNMGCLVVS